ncbi:hypothetical protein ACRAVF_19225 [Bradyrhizobium oligotrophicum S58]
MTFKWKITAPKRAERVDGVEMTSIGVECSFETGSAAEAVDVFEQEDSAFTKIFGFSPLTRIDFPAQGDPEGKAAVGADDVQVPPPNADTPAGKKRGPKPKTPAPDVVAPDPVPVNVEQRLADAAQVASVTSPLPTPTTPSTAAAAPDGPAAAAPSSAPAPALPTPSPGGAPDVPAFLDRRPAAAAAPPPPPLPNIPAPPIAAAAPPPVGVLGPKVVKALDDIKLRGNDGGQALADWLAQCGLTIAGKNYDDACRAVLMISDAKLTESGILPQLGVS